MENLLIEVLPINGEIVEIQLFSLPGLWVKSQWVAENQTFIVSNNGLVILSNVVTYWRNI